MSRFFFFDAASHVITSITGSKPDHNLPRIVARSSADLIVVFLIISEFPIFRSYFIRNWPLLSPNSGFVTLGVAMIILGVSVLGNLNKEATSQESLGLAFWRIVISSGIVVIVLGFINIIGVSRHHQSLFAKAIPITDSYPQSYVFRDTKTGVTARMVRSYGAVAPQKVDVYRSASSSRKSFHLGRSDTLPSYHASPKTETRQQQPRLPLNISAPLSVDNGQFAKFAKSADVSRPNLAHHPAMYADRV